MMLHIKFDSSSRARNFRHSKASISKISGLIRPKIKLNRAFMPVLDTSNFDDDLIKNEHSSMEPPFSHYKFMGFFRHPRAANSVVSDPIWPKFELVRYFMHVLVTCKYKKGRIKSNREKVETPFPPLKVNGGILLPWPPEFWCNLPQNIMHPFPAPVMLHIKFDQYWPTGLRDIQVRKCKMFVMQGEVTPKWVVWSGPKPTRPSFYACPDYQQLWWWFDQKWTS